MREWRMEIGVRFGCDGHEERVLAGGSMHDDVS